MKPFRIFSGPIAVVLMSLALAACASSASPTAGAGSAAAASGSGAPATDQLDPNACKNSQWRAGHEEYCASEDPTAADPVSVVDAPAYTWGDTGIKAEVTKVAVGPATDRYRDSSHQDFDTLVSITVQITNTGGAPWTFPKASMFTGGSLTYGTNGYDAQGWMGDHDETSLPARLVAGSSATMTEEYTAPAAGVAEALTYEFSPDTDPGSSATMQQHVWTDVQKIAGR